MHYITFFIKLQNYTTYPSPTGIKNHFNIKVVSSILFFKILLGIWKRAVFGRRVFFVFLEIGLIHVIFLPVSYKIFAFRISTIVKASVFWFPRGLFCKKKHYTFDTWSKALK